MSLEAHGPFPGGGWGGVTVWSEPSHIILKLGGYTLDHISGKLYRMGCDIWMPRHFESGLLPVQDGEEEREVAGEENARIE